QDRKDRARRGQDAPRGRGFLYRAVQARLRSAKYPADRAADALPGDRPRCRYDRAHQAHRGARLRLRQTLGGLFRRRKMARAKPRRTAFAPKPGRAERRPAPGTFARQEKPARLRAMGAQPAAAPDAMGKPMGTRLSGMAYRMLGDVDALPGRNDRYSFGRPRPYPGASRKRDRTVRRRDRQALRALL